VRALPPRILVALAVTVVALGVLAVAALTGGGDGEGASPTSTQPTGSSTTIAPVSTSAEVPGTSVVVSPEWYPKGTSRYSDRTPAVTITTLPPTTAPDANDETGGSATTGG